MYYSLTSKPTTLHPSTLVLFSYIFKKKITKKKKKIINKKKVKTRVEGGGW